jgi:hypothetical protein
LVVKAKFFSKLVGVCHVSCGAGGASSWRGVGAPAVQQQLALSTWSPLTSPPAASCRRRHHLPHARLAWPF